MEEIGLSERPTEKKADFSNLEREMDSILNHLRELAPATLRTKIQREVAIPDEEGEQRELGEGTQKVSGTKGGETEGEGTSVHPGPEPGKAPSRKSGSGPPAKDHPRIIRGGIQILPEERPDLEKEARFDGETVYINISHPAYVRAEKEKLLNYHWAKSVALSLIEFKLERESEPSYQEAFELSQKFFKYWGER